MLVDLTGKIAREGKYPCAHGGFADVWKGTWHRESGDNKVILPSIQGVCACIDTRRQVAIKVLRSRTDDPETEAKMHKVMNEFLVIFADNPHLGSFSDFVGNYTSGNAWITKIYCPS